MSRIEIAKLQPLQAKAEELPIGLPAGKVSSIQLIANRHQHIGQPDRKLSTYHFPFVRLSVFAKFGTFPKT